MPPVFNEKCIACFKCVEICPCDVLREGDGSPRWPTRRSAGTAVPA